MTGIMRHLAHRLNPVTIIRETASYAANKFIPQGAAELAQALNNQSSAYVPYGAAQQPVRPQDTMGDLKNVTSQNAGRTQSQSRGMSVDM